MGWDHSHVHSWMIWTNVRMPVEALGEDEQGEFIAEIPFVPWVCECGAWKWKLAPEVAVFEGTEI